MVNANFTVTLVYFSTLSANRVVFSGSLSKQHSASSGCENEHFFNIWKVAANMLNKQSRTFNKELFSSLGV
jgi:hypothetical protein